MLETFKTLISGVLEVAKSYKGDWKENDSSSPNYIKNRTHWTSVENVSVLPSTTLNSMEFVLSSPLVEGITYTVIFNGIEYKCVAKNYSGYIMIGNNALYQYDNDDQTDTGEPFAFECHEGNKEALGHFADTVTEAPTISITYEKEVVHKLDKKYIDMPDGIVVEDDLASIAYTGSFYDLNDQPTIYTDVVRYTGQSLTTSQKEQARTNIGAGTSNFSGSFDDLTDKPYIPSSAVEYNTQTTTNQQRAIARDNIDVYSKDEVYSREETYYKSSYTRTFYWNGDISELDNFSFYGKFYKISEPLCPAEDIEFQSSDVVVTGSFNSGHLGEYSIPDGIKFLNGVAIADTAGTFRIPVSSSSYKNVTIPSPGIYFAYSNIASYVEAATLTYLCRTMPTDVMGVVKTVNKMTPDFNGNVTINTPPADWNKLLNRPFGDIYKATELTDCQFSKGYPGRPWYNCSYNRGAVPTWIDSLVVGETYIIEWDGIQYECVASGGTGKYSDDLNIGNLSIRNDGVDTGEPFLITTFTTSDATIYTLESDASHLVGVCEMSLVKIDPKYLPELQVTDLELITTADIDEICGSSIVPASEVTY